MQWLYRRFRWQMAFQSWVLMAMIVLALLVGLFVLIGRVGVEMESKGVELSIDLEDAAQLSLNKGLNLEEVLDEFRKQGVRSLTVYEDTLQRLRDKGRITLYSGVEIVNLSRLGAALDRPTLEGHFDSAAFEADHTYIIAEEDELHGRIEKALKLHLGLDRMKVTRKGGYYRFDLRAEADDILPLNIGFPDEVERLSDKLGLKTVLVFKGSLGYGHDTTSLYGNLQGWKNVSTLIFEENVEKEALSSLLAHLNSGRDTKLKVGAVEFSGLSPHFNEPYEDGRFYFVRTHIIEDEELANMSPDMAVARWVRGVRERNIRLLLVKWGEGQGGGKAFDVDYVSWIAQALSSAGYKIDHDNTFRSFHPKSVFALIISLGVVGGMLYLVKLEFKVREMGLWLALAIGTVLIASTFALGQSILLRKAMAFVAAIVFPVLGLRLSMLNVPKWGLSWKSLAIFLQICLFSTIGGALIAGLLGDVSFMLRLDEEPFRGVKAALVLPPLLAVLCFWRDESRGGSLPNFLHERLEVRHLLIGLSLGLATGLGVLVILARSGNNLSPFLSDAEVQVRLLLERVFVIRPRTKELIAHPLMLWGIGLRAMGERRLSYILLIAGMVGQASIVNTLSHIHTPLLWSMARSAYGIVWGVIVGMVLTALSQKKFRQLLPSLNREISLKLKLLPK